MLKHLAKHITLAEAIEKGRQLIADWQWAYVMGDSALMEKYSTERGKFESALIRYRDNDFIYHYYNGVNA